MSVIVGTRSLHGKAAACKILASKVLAKCCQIFVVLALCNGDCAVCIVVYTLNTWHGEKPCSSHYCHCVATCATVLCQDFLTSILGASLSKKILTDLIRERCCGKRFSKHLFSPRSQDVNIWSDIIAVRELVQFCNTIPDAPLLGKCGAQDQMTQIMYSTWPPDRHGQPMCSKGIQKPLTRLFAALYVPQQT